MKQDLLKNAMVLWENDLITTIDLENIKTKIKNKGIILTQTSQSVTERISRKVTRKPRQKKGKLQGAKEKTQEMLGNFVHNFERMSK